MGNKPRFGTHGHEHLSIDLLACGLQSTKLDLAMLSFLLRASFQISAIAVIG